MVLSFYHEGSWSGSTVNCSSKSIKRDEWWLGQGR